MALLLGEDGRGYELARRLESCGAWRAWLGDAAYAAFAHSLSSAAAWDAFLNPSSSGSRAQLQLQLRARALLFDKASASLFLRPSTVTQISNLNPSYLQLHDDEIYFSLEDEQHDGFQPQFQRQMHSQMSMLQPQNIAFQQQQQWDKLRRRHVSTPRGSMMIMDKDQPMADVKIENIMEGPIDTNTFNALNKQQLQLRQQHMAMANHPTQSGQHFKQLQSIQIPQLQAHLTQNAFNMRTAPVKVEAFHELMGGDSTLKHELDQNQQK